MRLLFLSALLLLPATTAFTTPRPMSSRVSSSTSTSFALNMAPKTKTTEDKSSGIFSDEIQQEAQEVLQKVGWASPVGGDGEMTSEDPFVQQIDDGIRRDFGVGLDDLLNPAKV
jgi:hypothetical protein